ncbi:MAG: hypothetical protein RQ862_10750 [Candidatus Caldarchaeales archaeon]|nr:hypothetical protein [Candidatus Caldarchaeales archaeon]
MTKALRRLEKAADRILGRKKKGITKWVSEIRQPNNENYAIAVITASPYSPFFEWQIIIHDQKGEFLAAKGTETTLDAAKEKLKTKVENLYIWDEKGSPLNWNPPPETADSIFGEAFEGYKRWEVGNYLIVMHQLSGNKIEIEVVDPIKRITYYRNVGNLGEEEQLFGEAINYIRRHLLASPPLKPKLTNQ